LSDIHVWQYIAFVARDFAFVGNTAKKVALNFRVKLSPADNSISAAVTLARIALLSCILCAVVIAVCDLTMAFQTLAGVAPALRTASTSRFGDASPCGDLGAGSDIATANGITLVAISTATIARVIVGAIVKAFLAAGSADDHTKRRGFKIPRDWSFVSSSKPSDRNGESTNGRNNKSNRFHTYLPLISTLLQVPLGYATHSGTVKSALFIRTSFPFCVRPIGHHLTRAPSTTQFLHAARS
jgi:hypothetical protein